MQKEIKNETSVIIKPVGEHEKKTHLMENMAMAYGNVFGFFLTCWELKWVKFICDNDDSDHK